MKVAATLLLSVVILALSVTMTWAQDSGSNYNREIVRDWTLLIFQDNNGDDKCLIGTASRDGELRISYITKSNLLIEIRLSSTDISDGTYRLALQVDGRAPVLFDRAIVDNARILIRVENRRENLILLSEIISGNELSLLSNLMTPAALFSLRGSGASLSWLRNCSRNLD